MKIKTMPMPSFDFAKRLYESYKKRYFEQRDLEIDDEEWNKLMDMDVHELREYGCHTKDMTLILTARSAKDLLDTKDK